MKLYFALPFPQMSFIVRKNVCIWMRNPDTVDCAGDTVLRAQETSSAPTVDKRQRVY